jgi:hypothetical protein
MAKRATKPSPLLSHRKPPIDPTTVRLERGRGSKGRGGDPGGEYWHIYAGTARAGHIYINFVVDELVGEHASIQIQINAPQQGRGIGKVAYRLAVNESRYNLIYAHMRKSNSFSRKAAEAAGFDLVQDLDAPQLLMVWQDR